MGEEVPTDELPVEPEVAVLEPKEEVPIPDPSGDIPLWHYLPKDAQNQFYELKDNPDEQAEKLAYELAVTGTYKGVTRDAVQLDFATYVLTFAGEEGYSPEQTSCLFTICYTVLKLMMGGSSFEDCKASFSESVLKVVKIKSAAAGFTQGQLDELATYKAAVEEAEAALDLLLNPPEPESPTKGKPPPPAEVDPEEKAALQKAIDAATDAMLAVEDKFKAANVGFNQIQLKKITDFVTSTLYTSFKLYGYVFSQEQEHVKQEVAVKVETAFPPAPLAEALTTEEMDAYKAKKAEEAAAAEAERLRLAEEEAARLAAEAEAEAQRKREEEEAELRKRKPSTLDEAVEHAVAMKLLEEKEKLKAEYAAREEQLLSKLAVLENKIS